MTQITGFEYDVTTFSDKYCVRSDCPPGTVGLVNYHWDYYFNGALIKDECIRCEYQAFGCDECEIDWTSDDYYFCTSCLPGMAFYDYSGFHYDDWCEADTDLCNDFEIHNISLPETYFENYDCVNKCDDSSLYYNDYFGSCHTP